MDRCDEAKAIAAFRRRAEPLPQGHRVTATPLGERLWGVNVIDENDRPYVGSATLVGPDERIWTFSSNPSIHDLDVAIALLDLAYKESLVAWIDDDVLSDRIRAITDERQHQLSQAIADLRGGSMRRPGSKVGPRKPNLPH